MVNTKMTAIADKIRSILGITGKMGLDAMAANLETEQSNIAAAFASVESKGGTVPDAKISGNLANAILGIPEGAELKKKTGTFSTNNSGSVTVDCGFQPDAVYISNNISENGYAYCVGLLFEASGKSKFNSMLWKGSDENDFCIEMYVTQTTNGFSVSAMYYDASWDDSSYKGNFSYTAVKYT